MVDAMIKITRQTADDGLVARVREAEAAAAQAAEMLVWGNDDDGLAHLLHLHGGSDGGAGAAVDDDVMLGGGRQAEGGKKRDEGVFHGDALGVPPLGGKACFTSRFLDSFCGGSSSENSELTSSRRRGL
jgi:hypothetical protein